MKITSTKHSQILSSMIQEDVPAHVSEANEDSVPGDKFVVEVDSAFTSDECPESTLWRIKGFNSLVFDENGIGKLTRLEDDKDALTVGYSEGIRRAINCMYALFKLPKEVSGKLLSTECMNFTEFDLLEAASKDPVKFIEEAHVVCQNYYTSEVEVNDEVAWYNDSFVVTRVIKGSDSTLLDGVDLRTGCTFNRVNAAEVIKTGQKFNMIVDSKEK